jgi:hypothetical protein
MDDAVSLLGRQYGDGWQRQQKEKNLLDKQFGSNNFFIIVSSSYLLPTVNDIGDCGVTHISNHGGKSCFVWKKD